MVILRATSILGGQKEDKGMICSITHFLHCSNISVPKALFVERLYLEDEIL
jgi:hypothetical protein